MLSRTSYALTRQPREVSLDLAGRLRVLRKRVGYTQAELAERSGVSLGSLKRFEQSGRISLENLLALAQLLGKLGDFDTIFPLERDLREIDRLFDRASQR